MHWIGALDPTLRTFDIILTTANGTTYNTYLVRGGEGVAIVDAVKAEFADEFFARLESVARFDEIRVVVLNHLEPDHSGALPELLCRAPQARFSFDYYSAHIMRPFKQHVMKALQLIDPLGLKIIAPTHGPILRERPRRYLTHYRELSTSSLAARFGDEEKSLAVFYMSSYGNTARMADAVRGGADSVGGVRVSIYDLEGGETDPFVDLIEEADGLAFGSPTINGDAVKPVWDLLSSLAVVNLKGLAARNANDMKWKRFLYKQLCEAEGIYTCRAPSCQVCTDYHACFGPEH